MLFGHQLLHPCDNTSVGLIYYPAARELGGSCSKTILSYEPSSRRCPLRNCLVWKEGTRHLGPMVVATMVNIIVQIYIYSSGLS